MYLGFPRVVWGGHIIQEVSWSVTVLFTKAASISASRLRLVTLQWIREKILKTRMEERSLKTVPVGDRPSLGFVNSVNRTNVFDFTVLFTNPPEKSCTLNNIYAKQRIKGNLVSFIWKANCFKQLKMVPRILQLKWHHGESIFDKNAIQ